MTNSISRRSFIRNATTASASLLVACQLPVLSGCATKLPHSQTQAWEPNAWIQITPSNQVIFYLDRTEMGQGTATGLTTLIAEELNTAPHLITVKTSGIHPDFVNSEYGVQITGGSTSTRISWQPLRIAAATARDMLLQAAANRWNTEVSNCRLENREVIFKDKRLTFGKLTAEARQLSKPNNPKLKKKQDYQYIGKYNQRLDAKMKTTGTATFGVDAGVPFAYRAALLRCPVRGGRVKAYDARQAMSAPGILKIVAIENGVAAISESWWQAKEALKKIKVDWEYPELQEKSSESIFAEYQNQLENNNGRKVRQEGDGADALKNAEMQHHATYQAPFLAHATMEPMNCTVVLDDDHCEVWAPTQGPDVLAGLVEEVTGLRRSKIKVHTTLMGGGFGRRLNQDFAVEAAQIAKESGMPIQLIWSREDDIQNDFYRPAMLANLSAGLTSEGELQTWSYKSTGPSILAYSFPELVGAVLPAWFPDSMVSAMGKLGPTIYGGTLLDHTSIEGAEEYHYDTTNIEVRHINYDSGVPVGFLRSVGHSFNGFFVEGFMDELAHKANQDPVEYRLRNLKNNPRLRKTLEVLAEKGGWGTPSKPGYAQGVASHPSFHSYVSQMAEITVKNNQIKVHRVVCVVDCGTVVNPDIVTMQMESGIIFGLSAALYGEITFDAGKVQQSNFNNYPVLRFQEAPEIEVHIIDSNEPPSGVGEPGVPPIAAAVANAVFKATGQRLRKLPLKL